MTILPCEFNIATKNRNFKFLLDQAKEVVRLCREHSEAPVVLGGAGYSIFPEGALAYLEADMGIQGEGEAAFPMLLELPAEFGIRRMGFLLLGDPGETRASVEASLAFADSLNLDALKLTIGIRIYPKTKLVRKAVEEGRVAPGDPLLRPRFYLPEELRPWLRERITRWAEGRPDCFF